MSYWKHGTLRYLLALVLIFAITASQIVPTHAEANPVSGGDNTVSSSVEEDGTPETTETETVNMDELEGQPVSGNNVMSDGTTNDLGVMPIISEPGTGYIEKTKQFLEKYSDITVDNILEANAAYKEVKDAYNQLVTEVQRETEVKKAYDDLIAAYEEKAQKVWFPDGIKEGKTLEDYWYLVVTNQVYTNDNVFEDILGKYAVVLERGGNVTFSINNYSNKPETIEAIKAVSKVERYLYYSSGFKGITLNKSALGAQPVTAAEVVLPQRPLFGDGWEIDENTKTLTITKNVEFPGANLYPWFVLKTTFDKVVIRGTEDQPIDYVGKDAFSGGYTNIKEVTIENVREVRRAFLSNTSLTKLVLKNIEVIGDTTEKLDRAASGAFATCIALTEVDMENVSYIGNGTFNNNIRLVSLPKGLDGVKWIGSSAFGGCRSLTSLTIPEDCQYVAGEAFYNSGLTSLTVLGAATRLGYSNIFSKLDTESKAALATRMLAIMDGKGNLGLKPVEQATPLTLSEDWSNGLDGEKDGKFGEDNQSDMTAVGTQVTKAARWADDVRTLADVQLQFESNFEQGKDFLFVLDYSDSMSNIAKYVDSKFFNLQSKIIDAANVLLGTEGYDNRVGYIAFSGKLEASMDFTADKGQVEESIKNSGMNKTETNYQVAFQEAKKLIEERADKSRQTVIIFISDGMPNNPKDNVDSYQSEVEAIKAMGTQIFCVFMEDTIEIADATIKDPSQALPIMRAISSNNYCYDAQDTGEFSNAVDLAISEAYKDYILTDVVDENFDLVDGSFVAMVDGRALPGDCVTYDPVTKTITWNIFNALPRQIFTLTFQESLRPNENGIYPTGLLDTNAADAVVTENGNEVNRVTTPQLTRDFDLLIAKTLNRYNVTLGPSTFVFEVIGTMADGRTVYDNIIALNFYEATTQIAKLNVPYCDVVTVKEIYSGNSYSAVGMEDYSYTVQQLKQEMSNGEFTVSFVNDYNGGLNGGGSVINSYSFDGVDYQVAQEFSTAGTQE